MKNKIFTSQKKKPIREFGQYPVELLYIDHNYYYTPTLGTY